MNDRAPPFDAFDTRHTIDSRKSSTLEYFGGKKGCVIIMLFRLEGKMFEGQM